MNLSGTAGQRHTETCANAERHITSGTCSARKNHRKRCSPTTRSACRATCGPHQRLLPAHSEAERYAAASLVTNVRRRIWARSEFVKLFVVMCSDQMGRYLQQCGTPEQISLELVACAPLHGAHATSSTPDETQVLRDAMSSSGSFARGGGPLTLRRIALLLAGGRIFFPSSLPPAGICRASRAAHRPCPDTCAIAPQSAEAAIQWEEEKV